MRKIVALLKNRLLKGFARIAPIKRNRIIFINYGGKGFGDNPRYIAEELAERNISVDMVWLLENTSVSVPPYLRVIQKYTPRAYYELSTAHFIIENSRETLFPPKKRGQVFLQTWHGALPFKKIEKDAENKLNSAYLEMAKEDARRCDAIIVDCDWVETIYRRAFWLQDSCEYLRFGSPRLDALMNQQTHPNVRSRVCEEYQIPEKAFIVLYAPTFRNVPNSSAYIIDLNAVKNAFEQRFGETVILVRMHPTIVSFSKQLYHYCSGEIINASYYPDAQELVIASDCLISDYSSITFDFGLIRKPVFLCMKDIENYIAERGVYSLFYEHPFPKCSNEADLRSMIQGFSEDEYQRKLEEFYKRYPYFTIGTAAKQVVDWMIQKGI